MHNDNVRDFNYMFCPYLQRILIYTADISLLKVGKRSGHQMLLDLPLPVTKPEVLCWWNCWVTASLCWVMIGCVAVVNRNCVQSERNRKFPLIFLMSIYFHHFIQIAIMTILVLITHIVLSLDTGFVMICKPRPFHGSQECVSKVFAE